jgi:glutathione S-transferase
LSAARVTLTGYCHSVYSRAARIALLEKRVDFDWCEVDPFADPAAALAVHPFGRVPVLSHGGFALYETAAITAYVDVAFPGPPLSPAQPQALARMVQVIGLCDAYLYWPLVRQVYAHRVFRPAFGEPSCDQTAAPDWPRRPEFWPRWRRLRPMAPCCRARSPGRTATWRR